VNDLPILSIPEWDVIPGLVHGFCGRRGGVSCGPYAELNVSRRVGDDIASVEENWRRLATAIGDAVRFARMRQVHGTRVVSVSKEAPDAGEADALISRASGLVLSVLTADCVPILLVAPQARAVAVAHAGWRGTLAGVVVEAIEALAQEYDVQLGDIHAALGPAIGGCCYEVDETIGNDFAARWGQANVVRRSVSNTGKVYLELRTANVAQLAHAGVPTAQITVVGPCTRCHSGEFFSHRGSGGHAGRQVSFVGWR